MKIDRITDPLAPIFPDGRYGDPEYVYVLWWETKDIWRVAGFRAAQQCVRWLRQNAHTLKRFSLL